ncbi:MAG: T9SS C-terminal target domain-containing protein [Haliscomenobacteraceae bacterium CHB4]|nr:T9SS C-terminal target domain-containing protein [Haliscomenobacteraceae bacterium CHB4]
MRFLSFLPMLLLLAGSLGAQNQCSIFDLTATAGATPTNTCQYYVILDFEHNGTTNQFTVKGNGVNYGTFPYDSVPLTLGPFTAGAIPTIKEFVVTDAVYQDCQDDVTVQIPACPQSAVCDIYDLTVDVGDCNPGSLTYSLKLNFQVINPGNDFFEVWAGNGTYLGIYPLNQLPLKIPVFPWSGDPTDQLKVCINDNPDCCEIITFDAPDCNQTPCIISNLTVTRGECTSDSTYRVEVDFGVAGTSPVDEFGLWANDDFLGFYSLDSLPVTIDSFPWNGGATDFVKVCALDINVDTLPPQILCCKIAEFEVPDCLPVHPCGIKDLVVETDSCSSDSTFGVWVKFTVNDTSAVDSFQVWANGHDLGTFGFDSLPLYIPDFPWNDGIFSYIKICTGTAIPCCKELQFLSPACLPYGPCEVTDITVQTGACTSDSTYKVKLNFQASNPGDGKFTVWANGVSLGVFPLDTLFPLTIDSFPWNGGNTDTVTVCILDSTAMSPCCLDKAFHVPGCLTGDTCAISNVVVDPGDCNPGGQSYSLTLNFEVNNPGNDFFDLWTGNGVYLGHFPLNELPLQIPAFPCTNNGVGVLKICINDNPNCCSIVEFQAPTCCGSNDPCEITNLAVQTGDCHGDDSYEVWLNFSVNNPLADHFGVWANGEFLGTFNLDSLPLYIPEFPWNGGQNDLVKVCFITPNGAIACCKTLEFEVPDCLPQPCEIYNLTVETGDCTGDSTYLVWVNFSVANPPGDTFGVWANGQFLGTFHLDSLPLQIEDFPWNGGYNDFVKVCFVNANDPNAPGTCCRTKEFEVPDCLDQGGPCEIYNLTVETGDCTGDSTYQVWVNFSVDNPPGDIFGVWANGQFLGTFHLDSLPLQIEDFPWNGGQNDLVKVCFVNANDPNAPGTCCRTKEFEVPDCLDQGGPCEIYHLTVETGDCTGDSTYQVWINFDVDNPPGNTYGLWINGVFYDTFSLDSLPLQINDFPWNGGYNDVVKVCFTNQGAVACCNTKEFAVPDCLDQGGYPCHISDLTIETGDCTGDSTYTVTINFDVDNPPSDEFVLWANNEILDTFNLGDLPLTIQDFPWDGGPVDHVKVCIFDNDNPPGQPFCCKLQPFQVPDCLDQGGGDCEITNLTVETGDCTSDDTYEVWINFDVVNPPTDEFGVWANGDFLGFFSADSLPLYIADFPWNGGANDVVKVCFNGNNNPSCPILCCAIEEFAVPDCLDQGGGDCEVTNLTVETGDCTGNDTYEVWINFDVDNPPGDQFGVWANGDFLGLFNLDSLPLYIADFPWNGGANDVVKVCFPTSGGSVTCCKTKEFEVPDCLDQDPCHIYDLHVVKTPCLCGQFFALVSFQHNNGGNEGFDIVGNGNNYGNFPYNYPQPIILGPFNGDGTTDYEFAVKDHLHPDCADDFHLGTVDCMTPVVDPNSDAKLVLSPNPASNWLNVTAQLQSGSAIGEATVQIYHADGRLVRTNTVADGSNFLLDVADLPAGIFRLALTAAAGRVEGTFAKQ